MNKVFLLGRLTRNVDLRKGQTTVARVGIAVGRDFSKDKSAAFFNLVAFGKTAEFLSRYFQKGSRILVEGHLQTNSYDKDGVRHTVIDVIVDQAEFADSKRQAEPDDDTPF